MDLCAFMDSGGESQGGKLTDMPRGTEVGPGCSNKYLWGQCTLAQYRQGTSAIPLMH